MSERVGGGLVGIVGYDDAAHQKTHAAEDVHEAQHVVVIGDA